MMRQRTEEGFGIDAYHKGLVSQAKESFTHSPISALNIRASTSRWRIVSITRWGYWASSEFRRAEIVSERDVILRLPDRYSILTLEVSQNRRVLGVEDREEFWAFHLEEDMNRISRLAAGASSHSDHNCHEAWVAAAHIHAEVSQRDRQDNNESEEEELEVPSSCGHRSHGVNALEGQPGSHGSL